MDIKALVYLSHTTAYGCHNTDFGWSTTEEKEEMVAKLLDKSIKNADDIIKVALDGTGGDSRDTLPIIEAVRFAMAIYPNLYLLIFGKSQLETDLIKAGVDQSRYEFHVAQQSIPQDAPPADVLKLYPHAAMLKAMLAVKEGAAVSMISSGGTGPLVTLARHVFGVQTHSESVAKLKCKLGLVARGGKVRPCFVAKIPVGPDRFSLMLDLGANASCVATDLFDFAYLGAACAQEYLELDNPRVALLNVGTEQGKGPEIIQTTRQCLEQDKSLYFTGFIEANRIFRDDADVIVTDGFSGNIALKAAEGVADLFSQGSGLKKIVTRMARPEWLLPWQYNGSVLLGVNGLVIKSHASAGKEALAVAMVEAARSAHANLAEKIQARLLANKA